jgi:hypothetical protein
VINGTQEGPVTALSAWRCGSFSGLLGVPQAVASLSSRTVNVVSSRASPRPALREGSVVSRRRVPNHGDRDADGDPWMGRATGHATGTHGSGGRRPHRGRSAADLRGSMRGRRSGRSRCGSAEDHAAGAGTRQILGEDYADSDQAVLELLNRFGAADRELAGLHGHRGGESYTVKRRVAPWNGLGPGQSYRSLVAGLRDRPMRVVWAGRVRP